MVCHTYSSQPCNLVWNYIVLNPDDISSRYFSCQSISIDVSSAVKISNCECFRYLSCIIFEASVIGHQQLIKKIARLAGGKLLYSLKVYTPHVTRVLFTRSYFSSVCSVCMLEHLYYPPSHLHIPPNKSVSVTGLDSYICIFCNIMYHCSIWTAMWINWSCSRLFSLKTYWGLLLTCRSWYSSYTTLREQLQYSHFVVYH